MNKNLTKIFIIIFLLVFVNTNIFAWKREENILKCAWKKWFELYDCQKKQICKNSPFWKQAKKITILKTDFKKETNFKQVKKIYRYNQNQIYKCSILNSQKKSILELEKLLKSTDKSWILLSKVILKLENKLQKIDKIFWQNNCVQIQNNSEKKLYLKKIVLDQSTFEYCNYYYFLRYLQSKQKDDLKSSFPKNTKEISTKEFWNLIENNISEMDKEISHTQKMYSLSYETYTQYDSFIKLHIMLELLKDDYRALRDKLYQVLHPINQVIYKIINAQSK